MKLTIVDVAVVIGGRPKQRTVVTESEHI